MINDILIRKAKPGDEKDMAEFVREGLRRKNWLYTGGNEPPKKGNEKMKKLLQSKSPDTYVFIAFDKKAGKVIGSTLISFKKRGRLRHRINLGWGLHPDYQGKGIGTELVKTGLNFARKKGFKIATAEAACENIASIKMAKKCGFKVIGKIKKGMLTDDRRYIDTIILWREL